jgi:hypothetical protein
MTPPFVVRATPHYDHLARRLARQHPEFDDLEDRARAILASDPYNRARRFPIKKLEGISRGEGQYRLALRRFRFRYDIYSRDVLLQYCGLRREDTYR